MRQYMKWFVASIVAVVLFMGQVPVSEAASRQVMVVSGMNADVMAEPNAQSRVVGTLPDGTFVTKFSVTNGWAYVQAGDIKGYVAEIELLVPLSSSKIASSKSGLVVKNKPTLATGTLANLSYNMIVEDFGDVGNGWSFVQYGNVTGYVKTSFISTPKPTVKYVNSKNGVIVRNIASASGTNIGTIGNGTKVDVHATLMGWSYVTVGNMKGYVVDSFLMTKQAVQVPAKKLSEQQLKQQLERLENEISRYPRHSQSYRDNLTQQNELIMQLIELNQAKIRAIRGY